MGMQASVRMMVRIGSTRSTVPTTNLAPPTELISMRSPTTKGREMNCKHAQAWVAKAPAAAAQSSELIDV